MAANKDVIMIKKDPWMFTTFILGILLVLSLFFSLRDGFSGDIASEEDVVEKVMAFLNSQVDGEVNLNSISNRDTFYEVVVEFQGDLVPLQITLDGEYIISDLVPTSGIRGSEVNEISEPVEVEIGDAPIKGDLNAPVTIIEFSDYECPFCARFYSDTLPRIQENYIDTGKVKLAYRDFPLSFHPNAQSAAEAARCVRDELGDEGYFEMHDLIFENQNSLSEDKLEELAGTLGVDISICLSSGAHAASVQEDLQYGASVGVTGTPGFFVNGIPIQGAQPYEIFEQLIEAELSK